jgi:heat shock protein HslJ
MKRWIGFMTRLLAPTLAVPLLFACAGAREKEPPPKPFVGTRWLVLLELPISGEQPNFRFGDGRMEGFGGCNRVTARFVQDAVGAGAIAIGRIESGRRGCDASVQAAEQRMLEVLQTVSSYTIIADTMTMSGSAGTLKFRAVEERKPEEKKP